MNKSWRSPSATILRAVAFPTLAITLGMQTVRVLFPSVAWYLRDTLSVGPMTLAAYALGTFLVGFLAVLVRRLLGPKWSLWFTAGGLAVLRLIEQFSTLPSLDLWLSMAGTALFLLFLPIFIGHVRALGGRFAGARIAYGITLGLALDSAIHGAAGTLDLSWQSSLLATSFAVLLVAVTLWLLLREPVPISRGPTEVPWSQALPLIALGPYFLIQALIFQNQGWFSEIAQVGPQLAFLLVMLGNTLAIAGLAWSLARPQSFRPTLGFAVAVLLVAACYSADQPALSFLPIMLISQALMGWCWALLASMNSSPRHPGLGKTSFSIALGMLLFVLLAFVYYISLDIALPIPRRIVPALAASILGVICFLATIRIRRVMVSPVNESSPVFASLVLMIVPLVYWLAIGVAPVSQEPTHLPIRVMTYNIHSAYDTEAVQDPEAIARVIENSGADIIALQEISRGWLINGSTDLTTWLSQRLDMPILFAGTTGPMWGNAILSRYPILEHGQGTLPLVGTLLGRGYLWASIDIGEPLPLTVIATHLHHIEAENEVRLEQVPVLLDFWGGKANSVLLGDLNSEPHYPEIALFTDAGLIDSWSEAGKGDGLTWPAYGPFERIDWIWHTNDLQASQAQVIQSTASDHLALLVTLESQTGP